MIHNNGGEFIGFRFQPLLQQLGIKLVPTTVKNLQSNGIIEKSHNTISDILRVLLHVSPPNNNGDAAQMINNALATCMHVMRFAVNQMTRTSPGALTFNRDMLINVPLAANLESIQHRNQHLIDKNIQQINLKRIDYDYKVGDKVMVVEYDPQKLDIKKHGPYTIVRVFTNNTVLVQISEHVQERFNVRKLSPYKGI